MSKAVRVKLPIAAAFHARHLGSPDVKKIVGSSSLLEADLKENTHVLSTGSGKPFVAYSLIELLHQVIDDVLETPLYWTKTVQNVTSSLKTTEVTLTSFGPTNVVKSLCRALEAGGVKVKETGETAPVIPQNVRAGSGKIAVVGMSGRFPGGTDLEEFWREVLEKGRDMHSKVSSRLFRFLRFRVDHST